MYLIKRTKDFEKSFKKLKRAGLTKIKRETIEFVIDTLVSNKKLGEKYKDHQLKGELALYRECHIFNDLLLVYRIEKDELILVLVDIGK
ncbi:MAG: type II toxin-antitoxin system YafQ family toxin [Candidatus Vogelbacteria bacterium]|nr:type II toxin-antitoxin system YafQ family toxin [Candidatus Vogelbacteria bacterium]